jgi:Secretion system C-terminal sorting domain
MKTLCIIFLNFYFNSTFSQSNPTLTSSGQEPVAGDIYSSYYYDSVSVVPKSSGVNQYWDFSSIIQTTNTPRTSTFIPASSVPEVSLFPGVTLLEDLGTGSYRLFKSINASNPQFERIGSLSLGTNITGINYDNSLIIKKWPMLLGNIYSDTFSGYHFNGLGLNVGNESGKINVEYSGSGNLELPGSVVYSNVMQIKTIIQNTISTYVAGAPFIYNFTETIYEYYIENQRIPLMTIAYYLYNDNSIVNLKSFISLNRFIPVGINTKQIENSLKFYPNPIKEKLKLELNNPKNENCDVEIYNSLGESVLNIKLGNNFTIKENIDLSHLDKGTYILKIRLGIKSEARRLLVE